MVTYEQLMNEIDEYLLNYEEGFSTQDSLISIATLVREATPDVKNNTLHYAVKVGEPELVNIIIDNGADVNSVIDGQTPMMAAMEDPDSHWDKVRAIIETLLDRGANPSEVVNGKSIDEIINSQINNTNREADIEILENIRKMIQRRDRIGGKKRKRKRTQKKNKKRKSSKSKKRKSRRTRKHRK